jgi:hypothetical protein
MSQETYNMPPEGPARMGIFDMWIAALTQPREETFARIAAQPNATTGNALIWVFIATLISGMITAIGQTFSVRSIFRDPMFSEYLPESIGISTGSLVCGVPVGAIIGVLGFAIAVGLIQWIAKLFGGTGSFEKLAFAMSAIVIPFSVISSVLSLLGLIPYVNILIALISVGLGLYVLYLEVLAVKAVNYLGWGQALAAVFLPIVVIALLICCCVAAAFAILGPAISNVFNSINPGLY